MDWSDFFTAISLVLVFEGLMPFIAPGRVKQTARMVSEEVPEAALRVLGFILLVSGAVLLAVVRGNS